MANLIDVFAQNQYDLKQSSLKSKQWFQQQARLLNVHQLKPRQMLNSDTTENSASIVPGNLYMFMYDPKTKADLPYYDMFPLVFPYKKTSDGFIGLNMHYIPYQPRVILLQRLMDYSTNKLMNDTTKLKYSWSVINGVSKFKWAEPCIKQYLKGHLRSTLRRVAPQDWVTAMLLPVEQFVGANKANVWQDSGF